ncbi:hypothetical protein WMY93_004502 [Mugilogobius chulae]|uniref:EGF-like domain-containing protein n=1 Tax=Mugilogobius chulae TaxID=88201 RepID=A0AAW0PYI5_9GOBI
MLDPLLLYAAVSSGAVPLRCGRQSKACADGSECVLYRHVCDGEPDCKDGSDEKNCPSDCTEAQFQCAHGKMCIDKKQVCDGESQCQDQSDELHCINPSDGCVHHCDNKSRCLPANFLCDGERDCLDGTDEAACASVQTPSSAPPPSCSLTSKPCKDNSECVLYSHVCDGEVDCRDGSDEDDCVTECPKGEFQCGHGRRCIEQEQVCDGVAQCQDGSDEQDCSGPVEGCSHQCDSRSRCVPSSFLCDGERDCQDGTDELNCVFQKVVAYGRRLHTRGAGCVMEWLSARTAQMNRDCSGPVEGCSHQCDSRSRCVPSSFLCDGERDCQDGTDELNCVNAACSPGEFQCSSGQCVSASVRCDGHPDCPDQSDEDRCAKPPRECLVPEWLCDGDQDCRDGTDEKDCQVTAVSCGEFQWTCKSKTQCIPASWRCDGSKDCEDGSDQIECDVMKCPSHQFQCRAGGCLDPALVCNSVRECVDGSDEGGSCGFKCTEEERRSCSQACFSTPQRCSCSEGYKLLEDGVTCADLDECEAKTPVCSHICRNSVGSFSCDCHPGYVLEADKRHCKITGEPFLLASILNELFVLGLRSGSVDVLSSSSKKAILSVDYDWRERRVYWDSLDSDSIRWSSLDQKTTGTFITGIRADSVAVDWLGRNLYWIDGVKSQIFAVQLQPDTHTSPDFTAILDENLDQPRSLALLPQKGLMFWTEIGSTVKIERAGMDGSERRPWSPLVLQMKDTNDPFSLAVFNDMLYWSDTKRRVVQGAQKLTGKNRLVLLKRPRQPFGVKRLFSSVCAGPGARAVCKCPSGLLLSEDGLTCSSSVNAAFLLMLAPSAVTQIYLQSRLSTSGLKDWPEHSAFQLSGINRAAILDYSFSDGSLFISDDGTSSLSRLKLHDGGLSSPHQLLRILADTVTAMALDWVTFNVYWSSSKQQRIHVTSTTNAHTAVVVKEGVGRVDSIALHPQSGSVCFANLVTQDRDSGANVECSVMDGGDRRVVWKDAVAPKSLVFSRDGKVIYWADTSLGTIGLVQLDELTYTELKVGDGLAAVALSDFALLWMTTGGSNGCSVDNGGCSHLCLATAEGRSCMCAYDHAPLNATHCVPRQHCPAGSRLCVDQLSCQPINKFCNGHVDCSDHSDENCVSLNGISDVFSGPTNLHNSVPPASSFPALPKNAGTSVNTSEELWTLDLEQCSSTRCSGRGRCVVVNEEMQCLCPLLYPGDSCQDELLKTLQEPLVYGAVGLVTVIAVIVALVLFRRKRQNESSRRNPPAVKETSLTEIQTKEEPSPCVQTSPTQTDKPEEVVTPAD